MEINIINVSAAIDYIETHLADKLDLEIVARGVCYSKYHLHRVFTDTVGLTLHDYVQRRRLTEAAKLLVFSQKPIIEIALIAGYESQQAFTTVFKLMYKKTPNQYREDAVFYPLQLRYVLNSQPTKTSAHIDWQTDITYAQESDIPALMELVRLVVDGFPYLNEQEYCEQLHSYIQKKQVLIVKDGNVSIGAAAYNGETGSIDFLGIHPQYRKSNIPGAFLQKIWNELLEDTPISITTFRQGDKADSGYRDIVRKLGFAEAELLTEFGYPTQKFTMHKDDSQEADYE